MQGNKNWINLAGGGKGGVITESGNEPLDCLSSFEKTTKDILFKFVGGLFVGGWMNSKGEGKTYCNLPIEK